MLFPDCRHDDYYNEDFLVNNDHEFVRGYDLATETIGDLFADTDLLTDGSDYIREFLDKELPEHMKGEYVMNYAFPEHHEKKRKVRTYGDFLQMKMFEWLESKRNEFITGMIENMCDDDEDLYNAIRNKVLKDNVKREHLKEYYDTRKNAFTGLKTSSDGRK